MKLTKQLKVYKQMADLLCKHHEEEVGSMFMCDLMIEVLKDKYPKLDYIGLGNLMYETDIFLAFEPTEEEKIQVFNEMNASLYHISYDAWLPIRHFEIRYTILLFCIEIAKTSDS